MIKKATPTKTTVSKPTTRVKKTERTATQEISGDNIIYTIKLEIKHKNENQKKLTTSIKNNDITICSGLAGCGKTYMSCLQALQELKTNDLIKKIVLVKSVTTLDSEDIGYLKGGLDEKMEPFMYSFSGNFEKIIGKSLYDKLKEKKLIEILPIAYLRGVNIDNAVVIIDETQNITINNIRTILTRLGENSKMVFLGDVKQIDLKNRENSALNFLITNFKNISKLGIVEFTKDDVVRHPLIKEIETIFENLEEEQLKNKKRFISDTNKSIKTKLRVIKKNEWSFFKKIINFFKK